MMMNQSVNIIIYHFRKLHYILSELPHEPNYVNFSEETLDFFFVWQFFLVLDLFQPNVAFHIATSHLICTVDPITGFYTKRSTGLKWVQLWIIVFTTRFPRWVKLNKKKKIYNRSSRNSSFSFESKQVFSIDCVVNNLV